MRKNKTVKNAGRRKYKKEKKMKDRVIGPKHITTTNRQNFNNDVIRQTIIQKRQECSSDNIRRTDFTTHSTEDTQQLECTRPFRKVNAHPDNNGDKVTTEEDSCPLITTHNKIQDTSMALLGRNHFNSPAHHHHQQIYLRHGMQG